LLAAISSGCSVYKEHVPASDFYYHNPEKDIFAIGSVAVVELNNKSNYPEISADVTEAVFQEMQKRQVFSLKVIDQIDPTWRSLQIDADSIYTLEQIISMRKTLDCDAVLTGTVTVYTPYPNLVVGLRLKLVDLSDGRLFWALEQIWDSADETTQNRIESYIQSLKRTEFETLREELVTVSSLRFFRFVAYEVAETIQSQNKGRKKLFFVVPTM